MKRKLRVGIIGLGRVAVELEADPLRQKPCTHLGAWQSCPEVEVVAGADLEQGKCREFATLAPGARTYTDYRQMLAAEELDLVSICGYATERQAMIEASCAQGVRGIWAEKALACASQELDAIEAALAKTQSLLVINHPRRWFSQYQRAKALIDNGTIGPLESINVHFSGNMAHTGSHAFDVIRMLAGEVLEVQAWLNTEHRENRQSGYRYSEDYGKDYGGFALLRLESGAVATIHGHDKSYFRFEFEILGEKGMIRIGNTQLELWQTADSRHYSGFRELEKGEFGRLTPKNPWVEAARELIGAVTAGTAVTSGFAEGRRALEIGIATHISHFNDNTPVSLQQPLPDYYLPSR